MSADEGPSASPIDGELHDDMILSWKRKVESLAAERDALAAKVVQLIAENNRLKQLACEHPHTGDWCSKCGWGAG